MTLKFVPKLLGWSALFIWFGFIYLFLQYNAAGPTSPIQAEGRVYPSNNHGHIAYLTEQEEDRLHSLEIGALSLFIVAALIDYFQRNPKKEVGEIRLIGMQTLYDIVHPTTWFTFGTSVRRQLTAISIPTIVGVLGDQKRICLHSEEPISDCRTRLTGSIGFNTVGPVLGSIRGNRFQLYVFRKNFRNSFSPHFHGKLAAAPSGTNIEGKFRMHFIVKIFLGIWFTGVIAIGGKIAIMSIKSIVMAQANAQTYIGLFSAPVLLVCGLLMIYWGKLLGTDDETQILAFLEHTLNARATGPLTAKS